MLLAPESSKSNAHERCQESCGPMCDQGEIMIGATSSQPGNILVFAAAFRTESLNQKLAARDTGAHVDLASMHGSYGRLRG